jgi:V/A-type H+-transporting ATPase subunit D
MTGPRIAAPPGRAGRLWVDRRLRAARRGAELLDRKLHILQAELDLRRKSAELTRQEWEQRCTEAEQLLLRAALLGGQRAIRLAADEGTADVHISHAVTAGVHHPAGGTCATRQPAPWAGPATAEARRAHQTALEAAVAHAAAAAALRLIGAEAAVTRYRLRAIKDRWIPRLERARAEITFALDEVERADQARLRRAMQGPGPGRAASPRS